MKKLAIFGAIAALTTLGTATTASAKSDWVCWMQPSGVTACAWVRDRYHVSGIPWKPHSHKTWKQPCKHCSVDFTLTHANIADLGRRVDTATMRRFHDATLYGEKYRGPYNHD